MRAQRASDFGSPRLSTCAVKLAHCALESVDMHTSNICMLFMQIVLLSSSNNYIDWQCQSIQEAFFPTCRPCLRVNARESALKLQGMPRPKDERELQKQ